MRIAVKPDNIFISNKYYDVYEGVSLPKVVLPSTIQGLLWIRGGSLSEKFINLYEPFDDKTFLKKIVVCLRVYLDLAQKNLSKNMFAFILDAYEDHLEKLVFQDVEGEGVEDDGFYFYSRVFQSLHLRDDEELMGKVINAAKIHLGPEMAEKSVDNSGVDFSDEMKAHIRDCLKETNTLRVRSRLAGAIHRDRRDNPSLRRGLH